MVFLNKFFLLKYNVASAKSGGKDEKASSAQ